MTILNSVLAGCPQLLRRGLFILLSVYAAHAGAQGVLSSNMGTIEAVAQDDGRITISGLVYSYDDEVTEVLLRGEPVEASIFDPGVVVRFTANAQGMLLRVEVLGPFNEIRLRDEN